MNLRCLLGRHGHQFLRTERFKSLGHPYRLEYTTCPRCQKLSIRAMEDN